jgi:type I restriction enzyme R subunit
MKAFERYLDGSRYNSQQIRFIERMTKHGIIEPGQLYEPPFTSVHYEGVDGAFSDSDAEQIVAVIAQINQTVAA